MKKKANILKLLTLTALIIFTACQQERNKEKTIDSQTKDAVIYEVNIRQYTEEGTFKAFEPQMERLAEMGVDILWFMPIHPIGEKNRKGTLGSYYSVRDYKAVNPEFGTFEDFKTIVKKAHELGMLVLIDWVANHTAWDNEWLIKNPEWYQKDSLGKIIAPFDWVDVAQLDYSKKEMRKAMIDALEFWVREADIDGYRCDVAGMIPVDFWEDARSHLNAIKPVFMLAEDENEVNLLDKAFDMNYSWELHHIMNAISKGKKNANDLNHYFQKADTVFPHTAYRMNFITNHDENSWNGTIEERMAEAAEMWAVFSYVAPGMPLIYSGQEAGSNKRLEFFEKDLIKWSDIKHEAFYKNLGNLKKKNEALQAGIYGGSIRRISGNPEEKVFAFVREKETNTVVCIFNMQANDAEITLNTKDVSGNYTDYFTGKKQELGDKYELSMKGWSYKVLVR